MQKYIIKLKHWTADEQGWCASLSHSDFTCGSRKSEASQYSDIMQAVEMSKQWERRRWHAVIQVIES